MAKQKLDRIDKNILRRLQEDGRVSNVELAKAVGISAPPCLRRVRLLKDSGYIQSYHANLDHEKLGYSVSVFSFVSLSNHSEDDLSAFEDYVSDLSMVRECHLLSGNVDFLLKVVAKDWDDYETFLNQHLLQAPNVESVNSSLCVKPTKALPGVPID